MQYKIVGEENVISLERKVNELLKQGWEPVGGITIDTKFGYYVQVLIKK